MAMRPFVLRCRDQLRVGREKAREQHDRGTPGLQVSTLLADLYDDIVLDVWNEAIREHSTDERLSGLSLVCHGGFGRRDLAPYSDADLMLLTTPRAESLANKVAGNLTRDLGDAGIQPGLSIRQWQEACRLAWEDPVVFSTLTESRLLAGSLQLYSRFFSAFSRGVKRRHWKLIEQVVAARREERKRFGEAAYLLRPNVKRSRGGLRDIQLIRWIGFAQYGESDLERLVKLGALPEEDFRQLRRAYAFLVRLRHELHFRAGKSHDLLDRSTQMEIAEAWGYRSSEGMLAVEAFMQDYFDNVRNVRYASTFFVDDARRRPLSQQAFERLFSWTIDDRIRMGPTHLWVPSKELDNFAQSLPDVLRLMGLANKYNRRITHQTWNAIRLAMLNRPPQPPDTETIDAFMSLLSEPGRLAPLLRRLHELRILEQLIPEFKRMRGLLQFNAYHQYTVDAHSFRAVEAATDLQNDPHGMGRRYRRLDDKRLLHLALLIHDIGKGYEEDHCIVGARIAKQVAERLRLTPEDADTLEWLVRNHLAVNVVAFRHDLSDPQIVLSFAKEVGSIRRLELLVVHTYADLMAVGPGVATDWKLSLIEDLYKRTRRYFDSGNLPGSPDDPEMETKRLAVKKQLDSQGLPPCSYDLLNQLPLSLLSRGESDHLADEIRLVSERLIQSDENTLCTCRYDAKFGALRYTVIRREDEHSIGTFARATGALSAAGLTILRAQIEMVGEFAWDDYWVTDPEYPSDHVPIERTESICQQMQYLLDSPDEPLPPPREKWPSVASGESERVNVLPTKVTFDNETVDRYTILSLFAYDQVGLLYRIARTLAEHRVVLHFAKIDTHLDQIADVFYVSELDGSKLIDVERQRVVRDALLNAIE